VHGEIPKDSRERELVMFFLSLIRHLLVTTEECSDLLLGPEHRTVV